MMTQDDLALDRMADDGWGSAITTAPDDRIAAIGAGAMQAEDEVQFV